MQIKNKLFIFFIKFFSIIFLNVNSYAEEFNISAEEITIDKENNIVTGIGGVEAVDSEGKTINADKIIYKKNDEFLIAEGSVKIFDIENNMFTTDQTIRALFVPPYPWRIILRSGYTLEDIGSR